MSYIYMCQRCGMGAEAHPHTGCESFTVPVLMPEPSLEDRLRAVEMRLASPHVVITSTTCTECEELKRRNSELRVRISDIRDALSDLLQLIS